MLPTPPTGYSTKPSKKSKVPSEDPRGLITRQVGESLRINGDELRRILIRPEVGDKPIAIISIVGKKRTGKSFMLNFFIRYLRNKGWDNKEWMGGDDISVGSDGVKWKGGVKRCTTGIRIYDELFEIPCSAGQTMIVLLMDSQGLFDNETPLVINKTLLTLSTLASSVQIFNCKEDVNSQHLEYLKTCVDFAVDAAKAAKEEGCKYVKLQRLMFLVRDFPEAENEGDDDSGSHSMST